MRASTAPQQAHGARPEACSGGRPRAIARLLAITGAVGQQDVASRSIAQNVDDAAARTRQVSSIISAANEFAVQTGELAGRILQAAQDLSQQAVVLQTDAAGFIGQVKTA